MKTKTRFYHNHCTIVSCLALGLAAAGMSNLTYADAPLTPTPTLKARDTDQTAELSHTDKKFITKAAEANAHELALSQQAADRATNPDVKAFAQKMVTDHQQLSSDIADLASRKGVAIDEEVRDGQEKDAKSLSNKTGDDFDRMYVKRMVKGHKDAVELFQKEATEGKDSDVVALANKYLPIITEHNEHAMQLGNQFNK